MRGNDLFSIVVGELRSPGFLLHTAVSHPMGFSGFYQRIVVNLSRRGSVIMFDESTMHAYADPCICVGR